MGGTLNKDRSAQETLRGLQRTAVELLFVPVSPSWACEAQIAFSALVGLRPRTTQTSL